MSGSSKAKHACVACVGDACRAPTIDHPEDRGQKHVLRISNKTVGPVPLTKEFLQKPFEERMQIVRVHLTCPVCDLLPFEALAKDEIPAPTIIRLEELEVAGLEKHSSGCGLCRALVDLRQHWLSDERDLRMEYNDVTYRGMCGMSYWRMRHTDHSYPGLFVDFDSVLAKRIDDRHVHSEPLAGHTLKQIKHWISKCDKKHRKCFDHPQSLPTRVIDVRTDRLQLLDPSPSGSHQYVALSHCWGACRDFLTTRENLELQKSGFDLSELPATFRDAVTATRALGIPFLWIDSVCILQGDKDDWEIEGSKMADVYSNATLCIAATDANDDSEGFLKTRKQQPFVTIDITFPAPTIDEKIMTTRVYTQLSLNGIPALAQYPALHNRAWCLQERYLSPRILFFDRETVHWECLENAWFEAGRGLPKSNEMLPDVMPLPDGSGVLSCAPWCKLIESYTTRAITYATDKLPAVSALALRVAQQSGDDYLAGLWKSDLLRGLLWFRQVRRTFRSREASAPWSVVQQRSKTYLAPTWSWASYLGVVNFQMVLTPLHVLPSVKMADVVVTVPGKNKFGEVEYGHVSLLSPLLTFEERGLSHSESKGAWTPNSLDSPDLEGFDVSIDSAFDYPHESRDGWLLGIPLAYTNTTDAVEAQDKAEPSTRVKIHGILVKHKEGHKALYERVGCFAAGPIQLDHFLDVLRHAWIQETRIV